MRCEKCTQPKCDNLANDAKGRTIFHRCVTAVIAGCCVDYTAFLTMEHLRSKTRHRTRRKAVVDASAFLTTCGLVVTLTSFDQFDQLCPTLQDHQQHHPNQFKNAILENVLWPWPLNQWPSQCHWCHLWFILFVFITMFPFAREIQRWAGRTHRGNDGRSLRSMRKLLMPGHLLIWCTDTIDKFWFLV